MYYNLDIITNGSDETEEQDETKNKDIINTCILTEQYDEKILVIIKSQLELDKYNSLLDLLYDTSEYTNNILIHKLEHGKMDVTLELLIEPENKEDLIETINLYSQ